jgi:hypothetical protein
VSRERGGRGVAIRRRVKPAKPPDSYSCISLRLQNVMRIYMRGLLLTDSSCVLYCELVFSLSIVLGAY